MYPLREISCSKLWLKARTIPPWGSIWTWLLGRRRWLYLAWSLPGQGKVKNQDVPTIMAAVAANPLGLPFTLWFFASWCLSVELPKWAFFFEGSLLAWNHLRSHWAHFFSVFGSDRSMGDIISSVTGHFSTSTNLAEMQKFFKDRDAGAGNPVLKQTIETVQVILPAFLTGFNCDLPRSMFNFGKSMQNQLLPG